MASQVVEVEVAAALVDLEPAQDFLSYRGKLIQLLSALAGQEVMARLMAQILFFQLLPQMEVALAQQEHLEQM